MHTYTPSKDCKNQYNFYTYRRIPLLLGLTTISIDRKYGHLISSAMHLFVSARVSSYQQVYIFSGSRFEILKAKVRGVQ